jgi:uncharacterized protein
MIKDGNDNLLIIFIKNSIKGKVKTRLAADLGEEVALKIYQKLTRNTLSVSAAVNTAILLQFSEFIDHSTGFTGNRTSMSIQKGIDLGEKMLNAFIDGFEAGYRHICLIGTDCYGINPEILTNAFNALKNTDFVLGPANDGGYYLIGMNSPFSLLFRNKAWGTSSVLENTLKDITGNGYSFTLIPELVDVDTAADLEELNIDLKKYLHNDT